MANSSSIRKIVKEAFAVVVAELNEEFDRVIEDPNEFQDLGFIDQDIIDTGRLKNSKIVNASDLQVTWSWEPISPENGYSYASAVYHGFFAYGKKYIPGRRWTDRAVARIKPLKKLEKELNKRGLKAKITKDNIKFVR